MHHITPAQRYARAAAQAERDRKRPRSDVPTFDIGQVTLKELRGVMGLSLQQLSTALEELVSTRWSKTQLSRVETGGRAMTNDLCLAVWSLYKKRKGESCQTPTNKAEHSLAQ